MYSRAVCALHKDALGEGTKGMKSSSSPLIDVSALEKVPAWREGRSFLNCTKVPYNAVRICI